MKRFALAAALGSTLLLAGCLVPEQFTASADFHPDGSYTYDFDGSVVSAHALMEHMKGAAGDKDKASFQDELDKAKTAGATSIEKVDDYRAKMQLKQDKNWDTKPQLNPIDAFAVNYTDWKKDRTITVDGIDYSSLGHKYTQSQEVPIHVDGKLAVTLPAGAKVISTNGQAPEVGGSTYTWSVTGESVQPIIKFQLPEQK